MEYDRALVYAERALSNDAYDADANFVYGVINRKLGRMYDAKDGFGIAARSMEVRSAAYTQLAEIAIIGRDYVTAEMYADRALDYNRYNLNALKVSALCARKKNQSQKAREALDTILEIDPLNHFARFEKYLSELKPECLDAFKKMIRNEFPHETYLELAAGYFNLGLMEEAVAVLEHAPSHPIVEYWLAYLYDRQADILKSQRCLTKALVASPSLVYPFRHETADVLEWAAKKKPHWKTWYYLALIYWSKNRDERAKQYFLDCGDSSDFAPFYITRGNFLKPENPSSTLKDYKRALDLNPNAWRSYFILVKHYMESSEYKKCLDIARQGAKKFPGNYMLRFEYARALLYNDHYEDCLAILKEITILPHEGARYGHDVYRQACLLYGMEHMKKKDYDAAVEWIGQARLWPENLGVGRPYDVDNRIEDFLEGVCFNRMGKEDEARSSYDKIVKYTEEHPDMLNSNLYVTALALKNLNKQEEAENLLVKWISTDPQNIAANWAYARFHDRMKQADDLLKNLKVEAQGTPWNPVESDPDFTLILEIANIVQ
jgi:tetratricopeptide (TPR) repeat protein